MAGRRRPHARGHLRSSDLEQGTAMGAGTRVERGTPGVCGAFRKGKELGAGEESDSGVHPGGSRASERAASEDIVKRVINFVSV